MAITTLQQNNLYRNGKIVEDTYSQSVLIREQITIAPHKTDKYHVVRELDRLDLISYLYYSEVVEDSSKYWWILADMNNIENPLDISNLVGQRIIVPDILRVLLLL